jgi:mRNA interferase MazF
MQMQSTMSPRRGDVVLVPFPFTDLSGVKIRPALVVSDDSYNAATKDVIVAQITGNINGRPRFGDYHITGWQAVGLRAPSLVRAKLATLATRRIRETVGQFPSIDMQAVESSLRTALRV